MGLHRPEAGAYTFEGRFSGNGDYTASSASTTT